MNRDIDPVLISLECARKNQCECAPAASRPSRLPLARSSGGQQGQDRSWRAHDESPIDERNGLLHL